MYKKCAQLVDNQLEKPVQSFPHTPPSAAPFVATHEVTHSSSHNTHIIHNAKSHVLHSQNVHNNRVCVEVILHFHTPYYYYY